MQSEKFETAREFNNKFPSKIFICSRCKKLTVNPFICYHCGEQSNNLFEGDRYHYNIKDKSKDIITIFKPIELIKENKDE